MIKQSNGTMCIPRTMMLVKLEFLAFFINAVMMGQGCIF